MSTSTPAVDNLLAAADREWRALGIHRRDRATLAADLRSELDAATADGIDPAQLLGTDPTGFALRIAEEAGVQRIPPRYGQVLGVASAGAVLSLIVGYILVIGLHQAFVAAFDLPRDVRVPVWLAAGVFYAGVAAVVVAGAVLAVRIALRDVPRIPHTATRMTLLLPPTIALAIAAAAAFGWALGFPLTPLAIGTEAAIVLAAFLAATALARRSSVTAAG
ncbi:hypothetical protein [Micromonospora sediminimaris]|uniref:Uncharacterized protein n=1 Tax=Micromonospora sediminimaris TaxID=547162 RepID=A0A9W5XL04_9ACTN|nr:hypothetical protein [Micromonospora sediminimaris]GIJ35046.1 hypothetical protein Vse01_41940 [Micromonospora sediminimaris]SFD27708.1 hypothetical protein SAMN05216284_11443 [Micromonospora sediminimaris]